MQSSRLSDQVEAQVSIGVAGMSLLRRNQVGFPGRSGNGFEAAMADRINRAITSIETVRKGMASRFGGNRERTTYVPFGELRNSLGTHSER
jgi:hypothetical protein